MTIPVYEQNTPTRTARGGLTDTDSTRAMLRFMELYSFTTDNNFRVPGYDAIANSYQDNDGLRVTQATFTHKTSSIRVRVNSTWSGQTKTGGSVEQDPGTGVFAVVADATFTDTRTAEGGWASTTWS